MSRSLMAVRRIYRPLTWFARTEWANPLAIPRVGTTDVSEPDDHPQTSTKRRLVLVYVQVRRVHRGATHVEIVELLEVHRLPLVPNVEDVEHELRPPAIPRPQVV